MTRKLFNLENNPDLVNFLQDIEIVDNIEDADIVLFAGTSDVSPVLYGCKKERGTISNYRKDLEEKKVYLKKMRPNQLALGIGRGAQLLAVLNGAKLIQDAGGHLRNDTHTILSADRLFYYEITSLHHQLIDSESLTRIDGCRLLYYASMYGYDPEIITFTCKDRPKCLCIQGHPELMADQPIAEVINKIIHELCK